MGIRKVKYRKSKKSFLDEIKNMFHIVFEEISFGEKLKIC